MLSEELTYIWQLTVTHESEGKHPHHSIGIGYKPVLLFGNETGSYRDGLIRDHIDIGEEEKEDHEWQQPVIEASKLIEKFTKPDDVICDPMCGSGTTGIAALNSQRQAVLIDVDEDAVRTTKGRVKEVLESE
jgi:DNA modification methylase